MISEKEGAKPKIDFAEVGSRNSITVEAFKLK